MPRKITVKKPVRRLSAGGVDVLEARSFLDALVAEYKTPAYIASDPISLPYRYVDDPKTCEMVAFITALFSYGRRDVIIETMKRVYRIMDDDPGAFVENFNPKKEAKLFQHFLYRFNKPRDLTFLLERLQWAYREYGSLETLFHAHYAPRQDLKLAIAGFIDTLLGDKAPDTYGLKFLFAHPDRGGACKRFNMFLRWMVRVDEDAAGRVDFGLWRDTIKPENLLIPLDTHVMNMNRKLGMTPRNTGSWDTAEEITALFRGLCPEDPVKYDYALFGFSLDKRPLDEFSEKGCLPLWQFAPPPRKPQKGGKAL